MVIELSDSTHQMLRHRYPALAAPERFYSALCLALSGRSTQVDWSTWSATEWQELEIMAAQEGVAPLLHWTWEHEGYPKDVPKLEKKRLAILFMQANVRQQAFFHQVSTHILPALTPVTAPLMLLKGAALAHALYPHPALRLMSDLDILVHPEQMNQAVRQLTASGYDTIAPSRGPILEQTFELHAILSGRRPSMVHVEIHYSLVVAQNHPCAPDLNWFWAQTELLPQCDLSGPGILWLSPTAQLLYLAAHLMLQHGEAEMTMIKCYDLHALIARYNTQIDWDCLAQRANEWGWTPALAAALQAIMLRFQTPLPAGYLASLQSARQHQEVASAVAQRADIASLTNVHRWQAKVKMMSWPQKWAVLREAAIPSPAYMRWRYQLHPSWLWPLAYLVRWADALREIGHLVYLWLGKVKSHLGKTRRDDLQSNP